MIHSEKVSEAGGRTSVIKRLVFEVQSVLIHGIVLLSVRNLRRSNPPPSTWNDHLVHLLPVYCATEITVLLLLNWGWRGVGWR